jgi:hypothetical protein
VNEFCTCGARLPEGARFCHKCGKPQFELPRTEEEPQPAVRLPEPVATRAASLGVIGMRDPFAVRVAVLAGSVAVLLLFLPLPPPLNLLWLTVLLVAAGFAAVWLYQKRTGTYLSAGNGARLGTMVGAFAFVIYLAVFTLILLLAESGSIQEALRTSMEAQNSSPETVQQLEALLSSPVAFAFMLCFVLTAILVALMMLGAAGGALGAKVLEKD